MAEAKYPFASVPLCDGVIYQPTESSLVMFGVSGVQVLRPGSGTTSNPGELHSLCFQGCKLVAFSWFIAAGINYWLRAAFQSCFFLLSCWSLSLSLVFSINVGVQASMSCRCKCSRWELEEQDEHKRIQTYSKRPSVSIPNERHAGKSPPAYTKSKHTLL